MFYSVLGLITTATKEGVKMKNIIEIVEHKSGKVVKTYKCNNAKHALSFNNELQRTLKHEFYFTRLTEKKAHND